MIRKLSKYFTQSRSSALMLALLVGTVLGLAAPSYAQTPGQPTLNTVTPGASGTLSLNWSPGSPNTATSYLVQSSQTEGSGYLTVASVAASGTTYTNTGLINGNTYYYVIVAVNGSGSSAQSNEVAGIPANTVPAPPKAPATLTATPDDDAVSLSWSAVTQDTNSVALSGTVTYNVYGGTATPALLAGGVSGTSYVDTTAVNGQTYTYVVTAVTAAAGEGADSPTAGPVIPLLADGPAATYLGYDDTATKGNWINAYAVAAGDIDLSAGEVIAGDPNEIVTAVAVLTSGSGYTSVATVGFSGGGGSGATGTAVMGVSSTAGGISQGSGYTSPVTATVSAPPLGTTATASATLGLDANSAVTTAGSTYTNGLAQALVFTGGGGTGAAGTVDVAGGSFTNLVITAPGSGYTSVPTITCPTAGAGDGTAVLTADLGVEGISILTPGSGYTAPATVTITGGGGSGASGTFDLLPVSVTITAAGTGYTSAPVVTFSGGGGPATQATASATVSSAIVLPSWVSSMSASGIDGAGATATANVGTGASLGQVTSLSFPTGGTGSGYNAAPTVSINGGGGTGALATASINGLNVNSTLNIIAGGTGYTPGANAVVFTGGGGTGAAGTANVSAGGVVTGIFLTAAGQNYTSVPAISVAGGTGLVVTGLAVASGKVTGLTVTAGGSGYNPTGANGPTVSFSTNTGIPGTTPYTWQSPVALAINGGMMEIGHPASFQASAFNTTPSLGNATYTIPIGDSLMHTLSLYLLDYSDSSTRSESITITDSVTGKTLAATTATNFQTGNYYTFYIYGPGSVTVNIKSTNTINSVLSAIFFSGGPIPGTPVGVPTIEAFATSLGLSWTASASATADHYNIYRATAAAGSYTLINGPGAATAVATTSFIDNGPLTAGASYFYKVQGVNHGTMGGLTVASAAGVPGSANDQASAIYLATDTTTGSAWGGKYGADGQYILGDATTAVPGYITSGSIANSNATYAAPTGATYLSTYAYSGNLDTIASVGTSGADTGVWYTTAGHAGSMTFDIDETGVQKLPGVASIVLGVGGSSYGTTAPAVTISAPNLPAAQGGVQATATATIAGGAVTGFTITNAGAGYTSIPTVTIAASPGHGINATATATTTGSGPRQLAMYFLDSTTNTRSETVVITDYGTGGTLSTQTVTKFQTGTYLVYDVSGHVNVTVTSTGPANGLISGFFFDSAVGGLVTPPVPTGLAATVDTNQVNLSWSEANGSATSYNIYRGSSAAALVGAAPYATSGTTSYTDNGVVNGTVYFYSVAAVNLNGTSAQSSSISATPAAGIVSATAPPAGSGSQIDNSEPGHAGNWANPAFNPNAYGHDGYDIIGGGLSLPANVSLCTIGGTLYAGSAGLGTGLVADINNTSGITPAVSNSLNFGTSSINVNVTVTGSTPELVELYLLDYNTPNSRIETVTAVDTISGATLDGPITVKDFDNGGVYVLFDVLGPVKFVIANAGGPNAVISGVLFGTSNAAPSTTAGSGPVLTAAAGTADGSILLNWSAVANATAYNVYRTTSTGGSVVVPANPLPVTSGGSGYGSTVATAPVVTISAPQVSAAQGGVQATASSLINGISLALTNSGAGYSSAPSISFTGGGGSGATATAVMSGTAPNMIVSSITLTLPGGGYTSAPTVHFTNTSSGGGGAAATATVAVGIVSGIKILTGGAGYIAQPSVTIAPPVPPTANTATATLTISDGGVSGYTIHDGGINYLNGASGTLPSIAVVGGSGSKGAVVANVVSGVITSLTLTAGSGYTSVPTVTFPAPPALASNIATYLSTLSLTVPAAPSVKTVTGLTYTDTGLVPGTVYYYLVAGVSLAGLGANSNLAFAAPNGNNASGPGFKALDTSTLAAWNGTGAAATYLYGTDGFYLFDDPAASDTANTNAGPSYGIPVAASTYIYPLTNSNTYTSVVTGVLQRGDFLTSAKYVLGVEYAPLTNANQSTINFNLENNDTGAHQLAIYVQDLGASTQVTISGGGGSGASAAATVPLGTGTGNHTVTGLTLLSGGSGYTSAPTVTISGAGSGATATATISTAGVVTGVTVTAAGTGYGQAARGETISFSDTLNPSTVYTGATQVVSPGTSFTNGEYFVWNLPPGDYTVAINKTAGANAVVSGVFFGGGSAPTAPGSVTATANNAQVALTWTASTVTGAVSGPISYRVKRSTDDVNFTDIATGLSLTSYSDNTVTNGNTYWYDVSAYQGGTESANSTANSGASVIPTGVATATLVTTDTTTQGNWEQNYGSEGYDMVNNATSLGLYTVATTNADPFTFSPATVITPAAGLYNTAETARVYAAWYTVTTEKFTVTPPADSHEIALYLADYYNNGHPRTETVTVVDGVSGATLVPATTVSGFTAGKYLVYNVTGKVTFVVADSAGSPNAVVSGLFFGPGATAVLGSIPIDSTTAAYTDTGNATSGWKGTYGSAGYDILGDSAPVKTPTYLSTNTVPNPVTITFNPAGSPLASSGTYQYTPVVNFDTLSNAVVSAAANSTKGIAEIWYSGGGGSETFDVNASIPLTLPTHKLALYVMADDPSGRVDTVNILDANTGNVLISQTSDVLGTAAVGQKKGEFLNFIFSGHIKVQVVNTQGANCVASALFFD